MNNKQPHKLGIIVKRDVLPEMIEAKKANPGKVWHSDKIGSTYWWRMHFYPGVRFNSQGKEQREMDGYSKDARNNEPLDPNKCFCDKVVMLWTNNGWSNGDKAERSYFADSEKIEFYKKEGFICNKSTDPLFITLYQDRYEIPPDNFATFNNDIRIFLNNFYKGLKGQAPKEHLIPVALKSKDDMLQRSGWTTVDEVLNYAQKLKNTGFAPGAISGYLRRELERLERTGKR